MLSAVKVGDILAARSVAFELAAVSVAEVLRGLARLLPLPWDCQDEIESSARARERAGSTGIGGGVALPHGSCAHLARPVLAAARLAAPVDFRSPDGLPVKLALLLAVPSRRLSAHLYPLATLSQFGAGGALARSLENASSKRELFEALARLPL